MATVGKVIEKNAKQYLTRLTGRRKSTATAKVKPTSTGATSDEVLTELLELFDALGLEQTQLLRLLSEATRVKSPKTLTPHPATVLANIMALWNQDPEYLDRFGSPIPIRLRGAKCSFASLARRCAPDTQPTKLLSDLRRVKAVKVDRSGLIHPQSRSISVFDDKTLAAQHTLATLHGFIGTLRHNLEDPSTNSHQLFHRIAWNHKFDARDLPRFQIWLRNHGQHFLELADNWMARNSARRTKAKRRSKSYIQVTVGMYLARDSSLNPASP